MTGIHKEELAQQEGLRVVRLTFGPEARLKPHRASSHVVVVCVRGSGRWLMNGEGHVLVPGVVLSVPAQVEHAVEADLNLEVVVVHAHLATPVPVPA